jgi:hypothetical protein
MSSTELPAAAPGPGRPARTRTKRQRREVQNLTSLLDSLCAEVDCGQGPDAPASVAVVNILQATGRRSFGPLLLVIGLFAVSPLTAVPGMTWASAAITFLVAIQLAFGLQHPLVPRKVLQMKIGRDGLLAAINALRPTARVVDRFLKPRLTWLAFPPFANLIGLLCVAAALITIPLGLVPLAPVVPGLAIVLFGLGLTAKDGLLLALGAATFGGAIWLLVHLGLRIFG